MSRERQSRISSWVGSHWLPGCLGYFGRYKTICISLAIAIFGHIILVISAVPPVITKPHNSLAAFIIGVIIMGVGTGGFKPNISPLIVEQLELSKMIVRTTEKGERVIVDPAITQSRVYHYFYLFINIGALIGQIGMVYCEKYVGFWLAYLLPTALLCTCPLVMWYCRDKYVQQPPVSLNLSSQCLDARTLKFGISEICSDLKYRTVQYSGKQWGCFFVATRGDGISTP